MPKFKSEHYRSIEEYSEAIHCFHTVCGLILFAFAKQQCSTKDIIIRNFIARTAMMVNAVFRLWEIGDYQDCWILNRCLLDRLFHLADLSQSAQFELFDDWSFLQQYNAMNRLRSDPEFGKAKESKIFTPTTEQRKRYQRLAKNPPTWKRPKAEKVANRLDLRFLYKFGYDFGSTHVHPMANDGHQDFYTITKLQPAPEFPDQRSVLSNSLLVGILVIQEGLNASDFKWRRLVFDFFSHLLEHTNVGSMDYKVSFVKLMKMFKEEIDLCQPN